MWFVSIDAFILKLVNAINYLGQFLTDYIDDPLCNIQEIFSIDASFTNISIIIPILMGQPLLKNHSASMPTADSNPVDLQPRKNLMLKSISQRNFK